MFTHAIVKKPAKSIAEALSTSGLGTPDYKKSLVQHQKYCEVLKKCGLELIELAATDELPDSVFVEDIAVAAGTTLIITNPGTASRNIETDFIADSVKKLFRDIKKINPPGTLDGGDVMLADGKFFIGLSNRTNRRGAEQFKNFAAAAGLETYFIKLKNLLHLKTGISYIGDNRIVVSDELVNFHKFAPFEKIIIPEKEKYSANCIRVNDFIIIPEGYITIKKKLLILGYKIIEVDTTEFRKADGGLSCLSIRF